MKRMKNIFVLLLALCMVLSLCACGASDNSDATDASETVPAVTAAQTEASEETEAPAADGTAGYKVTVVDEEGNPIAGAMVQICMDTCYPGVTDASGVATFDVEEADYKVSFLSLPSGYTYSTEEQEFYFEDGSTEITLTLKAEE